MEHHLLPACPQNRQDKGEPGLCRGAGFTLQREESAPKETHKSSTTEHKTMKRDPERGTGTRGEEA